MIVCRQKCFLFPPVTTPNNLQEISINIYSIMYENELVTRWENSVLGSISPPGNEVYRYVYLYVGHADLHLHDVCCVWM